MADFLRSCLEIVRLKRLQFPGVLPALVTNVSDFNSCWLYFVPPQPTAPVLGLRECRGWRRNIWRIWLHHFNRYIYHIAVQTLVGLGNLVPRSLVDEAEGEIWQSKKIFFLDWLLHLTPVQSPFWKLTRFSAANFLQTQVLTWKFLRLGKMKSR